MDDSEENTENSPESSEKFPNCRVCGQNVWNIYLYIYLESRDEIVGNFFALSPIHQFSNGNRKRFFLEPQNSMSIL